MDSAKPHPLIQELGGESGIRRWVDAFYGRIAQDPLLGPLFPPDLSESRDKQFAFFVQMFGGAPLYEQRYGKAFLRFKHRHVRIGMAERDAWMSHLLTTLRESGAEIPLLAAVVTRVSPLADAMVNHHPDRRDAYYFN